MSIDEFGSSSVPKFICWEELYVRGGSSLSDAARARVKAWSSSSSSSPSLHPLALTVSASNSLLHLPM